VSRLLQGQVLSEHMCLCDVLKGFERLVKVVIQLGVHQLALSFVSEGAARYDGEFPQQCLRLHGHLLGTGQQGMQVGLEPRALMPRHSSRAQF